jgi:hypothetical protein
MVDIDTLLTILYVMVDDFDKACLPPERRPGPPAALTRAEVLTLALMGQWQSFGSRAGVLSICATPLAGRLSHPAGPCPVQPLGPPSPHRASLACFRYLVEVLNAQRLAV